MSITEQMSNVALVADTPCAFRETVGFRTPPWCPTECHVCRLPKPPPATLGLDQFDEDQERAAIIHILAGGKDSWGFWKKSAVQREIGMTIVD